MNQSSRAAARQKIELEKNRASVTAAEHARTIIDSAELPIEALKMSGPAVTLAHQESATTQPKETAMAHQDLKAAGTSADKPKLNIEKTQTDGKGPEQAPGPKNLPPGHPDSPGHPSKQKPKQ